MVYVFAEKGLVNIGIEDVWKESQIALNRRSVFWRIQWTKPPEHLCLPNNRKQAITVGSSLGFNVKFLHDCSNFDLPKLMPVENISLIPSSCLSLSNTRQGVTHHGSTNQEWTKRGFFNRAGVPYPLSPIPLLFPLLPVPYPFQRRSREV